MESATGVDIGGIPAGSAGTPEHSGSPTGSSGPLVLSQKQKASVGGAAAFTVTSEPDEEPCSWPFISSHYREWLYSPEQLKESRAAVHAKALRRLEETDPALAASVGDFDELLLLQRYFALQLLLIFQKKGLKPYALETACLFFHRFFLSVSALEVDIRLALFACLLLALKAIDVARHYTLGELLGDIEDLDLGAVVALELPVCEGLRFQLLTLHTREPLNELVSVLVDSVDAEYQRQQQQEREKHATQSQQQQQHHQQEGSSTATTTSTISSSSDSLVNALDVLGEKQISLLTQLVRLQEDAEASCLLMHASPSLPLCHPPCQLALAALLASPVRRDLLQQGCDIESILKHHILSISSGGPGEPAATRESENRWSAIQRCVEGIVEEVRNIRLIQKQNQGGTFSQKMADLLGKTIDAAEALEAGKKGQDDGENRREKKKRKKQKKSKKEAENSSNQKYSMS